MLVATRSAWLARATTSAAVALLLARLGSVVEELTVAVSLIAVPAAVPALTCNTSVKLAGPGAKLALVQVMTPADPTAGVTQAQPPGAAIDWKLVLGGVFWVKLALVAVLAVV